MMEVTNATTVQFPNVQEVHPITPKETRTPEENKKETTDRTITKEAINDKVASMNEFLEPTATNVKFQLHEELEVYYVQVIDSKTDEILREIPNKKFLDMYASMADLAGLVVDEKL